MRVSSREKGVKNISRIIQQKNSFYRKILFYSHIHKYDTEDKIYYYNKRKIAEG